MPARFFNGGGAATDYLKTPAFSVPTDASGITVSAWTYKTAGATSGYVACAVNSSSNGGLQVGISSDDKSYWIDSNVALLANDGGALPLSLNKWAIRAWTIDNGNNCVFYQAYPGFFASVSAAGAGPLTANTQGYYLGVSSSSQGSGGVASITGSPEGVAVWPGALADVAIWAAVLSAGEIRLLASGARPGFIRPSALLNWWPMDRAGMGIEPDLGPAHNNVTAANIHGTTPFQMPPALMRPRQLRPEWFSQPGVGGGFTPVFRKTFSPIGTRIGARQTIGWQ